jgi:glycosyltransferase involved in cell wall biosynthesis
MWRNHLNGSFFTRLAILLSDRVFCTSPLSFTARFKKTKIMPGGIDTSLYNQVNQHDLSANTILFFGRLSPVKNVHLFIESLKLLDSGAVDFKADIIGSPANDEDVIYAENLRKAGEPLMKSRKLFFYPAISYTETKDLYGKYSLYVNLTPSGSFDKTILEAMASGTPVLVVNNAFKNQIGEEIIIPDFQVEIIMNKINDFFGLSPEARLQISEKQKKYVRENHDLTYLINMLKEEIEGPRG